MKKTIKTASLGLLAVTSLAFHPASLQATTIYGDAFPGLSSNPLNGTTPATESGTLGGSSSVAWTANTNYHADGSVVDITTTGASAALPFVPQQGEIYTLSATLNTTSGSADWLAVGFEQTDTTAQSFLQGDGSNDGTAWMLLRNTRGSGDGNYFEGPANANGSTFDTPTGTVTYSVVLNTTATNWTETYLVNGTAVAGPLTPASNPTVNYVALGDLGSVTGNFGSFSLVATPEPSAWLSMVGGLGMLVSFRRFGRQRTA